MKPHQVLLLSWWSENKRSFPWRASHVTPYQMLVTEMLLVKTRAEQVAKIWPDFFKRFPDIDTLAEASEEEILREIRSLGLAKRASALKSVAEKIRDDFDGEVPSDPESLEDLIQVGDYVISAVRCFVFGEQVPIVDANVRRLVTRIFGCDRSEVGRYAASLIPQGWAQEWNYALLDLGAAICGVKPTCSKCPLNSICLTAAEGDDDE